MKRTRLRILGNPPRTEERPLRVPTWIGRTQRSRWRSLRRLGRDHPFLFRGSRTWWWRRLWRRARWSDSYQLDRMEPFWQLPERLGEDICAHGLGTGVLEAEDLPLVQVMQPTHIDTVCPRNVSHGRISSTLYNGARRLVVFY